MLLFYIMESVIETTQGITGQHYGRGAEWCVCGGRVAPCFLITNWDRNVGPGIAQRGAGLGGWGIPDAALIGRTPPIDLPPNIHKKKRKSEEDKFELLTW